MATQTTHYNLIKPASADRVYVGDLNDNSDTIDGYLFQANERADQIADDYNTSSTYNTDDYVRRENYLYKCKEDGVTGNWDVSKWDRVKVMDEINQGGGGSSTLAGLSDVALSSPSNGQLLGYDSTTQKWKNVNGGGGGSSTFAGLSDVSLSNVANGDVPRFNSTTQKWENDDSVTELALDVANLQSYVLTIKGDVQDIELDIADLSASIVTVKGDLASLDAAHLPYSSSKSTKEAIDEVGEQIGWTYGGEISTGHSVTFPSGVTKEWLFVCYTSDGNSIKDSLQIECSGGIGIAYIVGDNQLSRSGLTISLSSTSTDKIKFYYKIY